MNNWQCPLCQSHKFKWFFKKNDIFTIVVCRQCDLYSLYPRPKKHELLSLYPQNYEPFRIPIKQDPNLISRWLRRHHWRLRCRPIYDAKPAGGYLLDMGCATGNFLYEFCQSKRWQGIGVDMNTIALNLARHQNLSVLCAELGELHLSSNFFDVITMWEVIEHVPDPVTVLLETRRILKSDGLLYLSTPNQKSLQAYLWGKYWAGWETPRHLQVFSLKTLNFLFEKTDFCVTKKLYFPTNRFFAMESANRLCEYYIKSSFQSTVRKVAILLGLLGWPVFRIIDYISWSSSMILEVRAI